MKGGWFQQGSLGVGECNSPYDFKSQLHSQFWQKHFVDTHLILATFFQGGNCIPYLEKTDNLSKNSYTKNTKPVPPQKRIFQGY